jgi:hypothetical protein
MAERNINWNCLHLRRSRGAGDFDFGYDLGGGSRVTYRCWQFPGEGVINPAVRCGPACGAFALQKRRVRELVKEPEAHAQKKPKVPTSLPTAVQRGIIYAKKQDIDTGLAKRIREAERVESDLRSAETQLTGINAEMEQLNAAEAYAAHARDEATTEWLAQLKGKHSSLHDLRDALDSKGFLGIRALEAESRLADLAARREALRARRLDWERIKNRLLPELDLSLQRRRLLERLRDELNRLVDDRLSREAAPGRVASPQDFDALFTTVRTCLQDGIPLATLQETVENLEGSTDLPI